jgi:MYXO-CTERM domain-containing protein
VLGQRRAGASVRVWQRTGFAGVVICALAGVAASSAFADRRPQPDPSELWRAYPLEQKPATVAKSPSATSAKQRGAQKPASSPANEGSDRPPRALIAAIGAAAALLAVALIALRRRRRRPAAPALPRAAPHAALFPAPPVAPRLIEPAAPGPAPAARPGNGQRAAAARKAVTCQVRWNRRGRSFYAVLVDADGIEHMLMRSPRLDEAGPAPPDETPEARAALRQLAKQLRERGWRPLRAKGIDFDERRWYARRFRWPTEEELAEAGRADVREIDEEVSGRWAGGR